MAAQKRILLRMPEELHTLIDNRANEHLRSVNSELIVLLKRGLACSSNERESLKMADRLLASKSKPQTTITKAAND